VSGLRKLFAVCLCLGAIAAALAPGVAQAAFGIKTLSVTPTNREGKIEDRAGAHPYEYIVNVGMNLKEDAEETPEGTLSTVIVELPPGFVGNPLAVPRCPRALFSGLNPHCSPASQVGIARVTQTVFGPGEFPVYNLVPPSGSPFSLGASLFSVNSFQEGSIRTGGDYGANVSAFTVPTGISIQSIRFSVWGVPNDQSHNPQRWCRKNGVVIEGDCTSEEQPLPFLTLPTSCTGPMTTTVHVESVEQPGMPVSKSVQSLNGDGEPGGLRNCEAPPFDPAISAQPETTAADSPTGLHASFHIPQTTSPEGIATSHLRETDLTFPKGLALNPSAAGGLASCTPVQADLKGPGPANCPAASKVGTVSVDSPLIVDHPLLGSVYLASQGAVGSLFGLYIAVEDPLTGVIVKQPVKLEPDSQSGQLRAVTAELPQLPFEDLDFEFTGGPRAPLTTPQTCGSFTTSASLVPWARPSAPVNRSASFKITAGAGGAPCPPSEAAAPNAPSFEAGTVTPIAGSYSPFVLKLSRENGSQRISAIDTTLPEGLVGKLSGIPYCSEAQIAAATARSQPGQGALELTSPSCPLASEVGSVDVGAGSGAPLHVQGRAYLAGPYKGAPLSLVVITPAIAGPFDLGTVVVRAALYVNEETAQVHAVSDPLPSSLAGIPLDVRSIVLSANRPNFMLNPTNCNPMSVLASASSIAGQTAALSSPFQVGACGALAFKPNVAISLKGGMRRAQHPKLRAVATYPKGEYANTAKLSAILPRSEFIDPEHVANPCTRPQFAAAKCPKGSIIGTVTAYTPLLEKPLTGKVYFRANGGARELPDVVLDLNGQVHFVAVGYVDAVVKKGTEISRIRTTFANVPDAPLSKVVLELKGGKAGVLVNSENLCAKQRRATVKTTAHNGKVHNFEPVIATSCAQSPKQKRHH
jgi:hypothetical protein